MANTKSYMLLSTLLLCFTLYLSAISKFKSLGAYIGKGRFNGGDIFAFRVCVQLIFGGLELIHGCAFF